MSVVNNLPVLEQRIREFEKRAYGMFIHWGVYSLLERGEKIMRFGGIPKDEYKKLMEKFTARHFDARKIAKFARKSGMKYITITTRHHDGFSLFDTKGLSDFDAPHSAAKRDLIAEFVDGCRQEGIIPVLYHTTMDWYQDSYNEDFDTYLEYLRSSVEILCRNYGEIGGLWFDGNWNKPDADWKLDELYGTIRKYQPNAIVINNTGISDKGRVIHTEIDSVTFEQGRPTPMDRKGMKKYVAAEMNQTINEYWGIGKMDFINKSTKELIENLCACRKVGANYLLNVSPTADGKIPKLQKATIEVIGEWLKINGKAIYETRPCSIKGLGDDFALQSEDGRVYIFVHNLKINHHKDKVISGGGVGAKAFSGLKKKVSAVRWLDNGEELPFTQDTDSGIFCFHATGYPYGVNFVVRIAEVETV